MRETKIQWTDSTWNPLRGCSRVSRGCENCYAERHAGRFAGPGQPFEGFARATTDGARWTGRVDLVPHMLDLPLRWRAPRRIFVNSMSDLFHESVSNEDIAAIFGVMAASPQHTFQVLTKRAKRMADWFRWVASQDGMHPWYVAAFHAARRGVELTPTHDWPLPNVWLGVSVEDQATADERIDHLCRTPAAVRFLSCEPLIGPLEIGLMGIAPKDWNRGYVSIAHLIQWVIVGGESGPGARPFDLAWARAIVAECRAVDVACFVKQLGRRPTVNGYDYLPGTDPKHGDPREWPEDLRIRQWPEEATC